MTRPSLQEFAALAAASYLPDPGPLPVQGWRVANLVAHGTCGLHAVFFLNDVKHAAVLAVRGTDCQNFANLQDDLALALGHLPDLAFSVQHMLKRVDSGGFRLFLTGHSLGATAVSVAYAMLWVENPYQAASLGAPVLFESPGIPDNFRHITEMAAACSCTADLEKARDDAVEVFGAPNPINMLHEHFGRTRYRVKLPHGQQADPWRRARCVVGSVARMAMLGSAAAVPSTAAWAAALVPAAADAGEAAALLAGGPPALVGAGAPGATALAASVSLGRMQMTLGAVAFGLQDLASWTLRQHSISGLRDAFEPGADLPRDYQLVLQWPSGKVMVNGVFAVLRSAVPFHPANQGIHTMLSDPDEIVEQNVCRMVGYEYIEP